MRIQSGLSNQPYMQRKQQPGFGMETNELLKLMAQSKEAGINLNIKPEKRYRFSNPSNNVLSGLLFLLSDGKNILGQKAKSGEIQPLAVLLENLKEKYSGQEAAKLTEEVAGKIAERITDTNPIVDIDTGRVVLTPEQIKKSMNVGSIAKVAPEIPEEIPIEVELPSGVNAK